MPLSLGLQPHAYFCETSPDKDRPVIEGDTYNCGHCGATKFVRSAQDNPQAKCKRCMGLVCEGCAPKGACNNTDNLNLQTWIEQEEKKAARLQEEIDRQLDRQASRRSYGM